MTENYVGGIRSRESHTTKTPIQEQRCFGVILKHNLHSLIVSLPFNIRRVREHMQREVSRYCYLKEESSSSTAKGGPPSPILGKAYTKLLDFASVHHARDARTHTRNRARIVILITQPFFRVRKEKDRKRSLFYE